MISSIQETDHTTPANKGGKYWYYSRTNEGDSYNMYCRAPYDGDDLNIDWNGSKETSILPGEE
eukprot:scaffold9791_cov113-Chaetoceros_neogracile.AAC.1